jgi:hypothetical protein
VHRFFRYGWVEEARVFLQPFVAGKSGFLCDAARLLLAKLRELRPTVNSWAIEAGG